MFDSNDEYDFTPSASSKLASLFNATMYTDEETSGSNTTLTYTAPKQPKKEIRPPEKISNPKPQSSVILAKVVNLWKVDSNKEKQALGKHGMAIIGNLEHNLFECIIYKEKNNILIRVKLNENFTWYTYADNFGAFYDNQHIFWMAKFIQVQDEATFLDELVKYKCKVVNNDLPETKKVEVEVTLKNEDEARLDTTTKANILSRITKMGQQILPQNLVNHTSTDLSDSELDETNNKKPILAPRKFKRSQNASEKSSHLHLAMTPQQSFSVQESSQNQMVLIPSSQIQNNALVYGHLLSDPAVELNKYLLQQNAEMKNDLTQITTKLDNLIGQEKTNNSDSNIKSLKSKIKVLELRIENLVSELEQSKSEVTKLKRKSAEENKNTELESESIKKLQQKELEVKETLEKLGIQSLDGCFDLITQNNSYKIQIDELNNSLADLELKVKDFETSYEHNKVEEKNVQLDKSRDLEIVSQLIKKHMNSLYQQIVVNFGEDDELFSNKIIQQVFAKKIKEVTFNLVSELHDVHKNKFLTD